MFVVLCLVRFEVLVLCASAPREGRKNVAKPFQQDAGQLLLCHFPLAVSAILAEALANAPLTLPHTQTRQFIKLHEQKLYLGDFARFLL